MKEISRIEGTKFVRSVESSEADKARLKELLQSRRAPMTRGLERSFQEGWANDDGLGGSNLRERYYEEARKAGISTAGKKYIHGLADYTFDPNGWVSDGSEVLAKCKAQGKSCEGFVNYTAPEPAPMKGCRLAEDLVQECIADELTKDPSQASNMTELREKVIETHGAKKGSVIHNTVIE